MEMNKIANLLFEAAMLKQVPRSGFAYLGAGRESVAEHAYTTTFIAFVLAQMDPRADLGRLVCMCLLHDLPEARIGDLNTVHKRYLKADEEQAFADATRGLPFGEQWRGLLAEFNDGATREAQLARDADQIALVLELKGLMDIGHEGPRCWLPNVLGRLQTEAGKRLARAVLDTDRDAWWRDGIPGA